MTMNGQVPLAQDETLDAILDGRIRIIQKKNGYRFAVDTLLLARFAEPRPGEALIDLGTGSGVLAIGLAYRHPSVRVLGVDIREEFAAMAGRSVVLNGLEGRVEIRRGDVRLPADLCAPLSFDAAVFNPPYRRLCSGRVNPDPVKAAARHEIDGTLGDFVAAAAYALKEGGRAWAVYPAKRLAELLFRMRSGRLEPKRLRVVHSRPGGAGVLVLVEGVKGGGEELALLPPLYIYGDAGAYSGQMETIFRELAASPSAGGG